MNLKELKNFIQLAKKEGVHELKYEQGDTKYAVRLTDERIPVVSTPSPQPSTTQAVTKGEVDKNIVEITSPFVGTFYEASSPNSNPYVKVGDRISPGTVLCIVEAMKIMNEIESDISGVVTEICCENENYVEFGQVLFKIKK